MNTARSSLAGVGTAGLALGAGGYQPGLSALTEEWIGAGPVVITFTDS